MSESFGRRCRVQIEDLQIDTGAPGADEGLRIAFRIEKTLDSKPNKLELNVYNLSKRTRDRITKAKVALQLEAGYGDSLGLLFKGDIRAPIRHVPEGVYIVTKISSGDGDVALRSARINANYAANTKVADILVKMVEKFGISAEQAKQRIKRGDFRGGITELTKGFAFSGDLQQEFDRRMKSVGLNWSIQNGEMLVLGENETTQQTALRISPDSGLIGSPEILDKGVVRFESLLQSDLNPGRKTVLASREVNATLKLQKCIIEGDTEPSGKWSVTAEGVRA